MNARTTPIMTVHPIKAPCVSIPQNTAGCTTSAIGLNTSFHILSSVLRPLNSDILFTHPSRWAGTCPWGLSFSLYAAAWTRSTGKSGFADDGTGESDPMTI